jgi:hypothetical protein
VTEARQTKGIVARARELNFWATILKAASVSIGAMGALALRAYQSFGIGNTAMLAVAVALLGIWGIPRIFERVRPRKPTIKEMSLSGCAALLVLFVWTADKLPLLFEGNEPSLPSQRHPEAPAAPDDLRVAEGAPSPSASSATSAKQSQSLIINERTSQKQSDPYTPIPPISGNVVLELIQSFHSNFERED